VSRAITTSGARRPPFAKAPARRAADRLTAASALCRRADHQMLGQLIEDLVPEGHPAAHVRAGSDGRLIRQDEAVAHARLGDQQLGYRWVVELATEVGHVDLQVRTLLLTAGSPDAFEQEVVGTQPAGVGG
jgi:hypothetical protein